MSDPKQQDPDSIGHAAYRSRDRSRDSEPIPLARLRDREDWPAQRKLDETVAHLRAAAGRDQRPQKQPDIFAEAVAKAMQAQLGPELVEAPSVLQHRQSSGIAAKCAIAAAVAAVAALVFVVAFPASQQAPVQQNAATAEPTSSSNSLSTWQSLKSLFQPPQRRPAPTLVVRDSSGTVNEPLPLGVNVTSPGPGATVTISRMPTGATLTFGRRISTGEWRVPAQDISDASIIPPADFVGEMYLTAELRGSDGAALVSSFVRLTWTSGRPGDAVAMSASAATVPSLPAAPTPQQQPQQQPQPPQPPQQLQPIAPPEPPTAARAEPPMREIDPREVAGFVKRAQELLAAGDLQAARLLLLHAAEAHDARAAYLLAKTFDPIVSKQFGVADTEPDLAQARNWYQKAEDWGAPEAKRELDALASFSR